MTNPVVMSGGRVLLSGGSIYTTGFSAGGGGGGNSILNTNASIAQANGTTGVAYSQQLVASQGVGPWSTWAIVNASCDLTSASAGTAPTPANTFALSSSGVLSATSGNMVGAENDYFLVSYKDSTAATFTQYAVVNVSAGTNPLRIVTPSNIGYVTQGNVYSGTPLATIAAKGNVASITWSILSQTTTGSVNNSWSINSSTGAITGTATNTGVNTITVQATDGTNTTSEVYNVGVYQYVTSAPRPSANPSSGTNSQGIPCGPGMYVVNGEVYESNGTLFKGNVGWNATFPSLQFFISTPRYNAMGMNLLRVSPDQPANLAAETSEVAESTTQQTNNHRVCMYLRMFSYAGTQFSGSSVLSVLGESVNEWVGAFATVYSPLMNKIWVNIANEWGSFSGTTTGFAAAYSAVSAPVTGLTASTLTFSGSTPFNATNIGLGFVYIKGATWSGANNDGLYPVTASGANTVTGTFPAGYVSGGTVWGGAIGMMRAAGYYCPLVVDCGGGSSYLDVINNGVAIFQSDPLQSTVMSYHAYYNGNTASTSQAGFESVICSPMNSNKVTSGVPWIVGELGVYFPDGRAGTPTGGVTTDFPIPQYLQSVWKYGIPALGWVSFLGGSNRADTSSGFAWYKLSASDSDASDAGYPAAYSVHGKRITLDPIYGSVANNVGVATSF